MVWVPVGQGSKRQLPLQPTPTSLNSRFISCFNAALEGSLRHIIVDILLIRFPRPCQGSLRQGSERLQSVTGVLEKLWTSVTRALREYYRSISRVLEEPKTYPYTHQPTPRG